MMRALARPLVIMLLVIVLLALVTPIDARAQDASADPLVDPIVHGAWLYAGNCVRCHGAYAEARWGEDKTDKTLKAEISGESRQGCAIDWSVARGGSLTVKAINALAAFMLAWEEQGGDLALPPLPPQPTPTPSPATAASGAAAPAANASTPTPTSLPPDLQLALESNPLAHGAWLYAQNCYRCHRDYAIGRMGLGLERDRIERTIQGGKTGSNMPAFALNRGGPLRSIDIKLIVNYIEAFEQLGAAPALPDVVQQTMVQPLDPAMLTPIALPTASLVQGDATRGALLYRAYCATCHGASGQGGSGPVLARSWPGVRPDLMLRAVVAQGVPGAAMRGWAQAHGGPLDEAMLDDVVAYLSILPSGAFTMQQMRQSTAFVLTDAILRNWLGVTLLVVVVGGIGGALWRRRQH